jgi:hypothetical protein
VPLLLPVPDELSATDAFVFEGTGEVVLRMTELFGAGEVPLGLAVVFEVPVSFLLTVVPLLPNTVPLVQRTS